MIQYDLDQVVWTNTTIYDTAALRRVHDSTMLYAWEHAEKNGVSLEDMRTAVVPEEIVVLPTTSQHRVLVQYDRDWSKDGKAIRLKIYLANRTQMMTTELDLLASLGDHAVMPAEAVALLVHRLMQNSIHFSGADAIGYIMRDLEKDRETKYRPPGQIQDLARVSYIAESKIAMGLDTTGAEKATAALIRAQDRVLSIARRQYSLANEENHLVMQLDKVRSARSKNDATLTKLGSKITSLRAKLGLEEL